MAQAPRPGGPRLQDSRILVFDTETTGVDVERDRVVEVGVTLFEDGASTRAWHTRVNPRCAVPPEASAVHGLRDEDLADQPTFAEIAPQLLSFLRGDEIGGPVQLAGYNAVAFDAPLLNREFARAGIAAHIEPSAILDPVYFARWHHRDLRKRNLAGMCEHYRIDLDGAHSVAADTRATGALLYGMAAESLIPATIEAALTEQARLQQMTEEEFRRWSYWLYADRQDGRLRLGASRHCGSYLENVDLEHLRYLLKIPDLPHEVRLVFEQAVRWNPLSALRLVEALRGGGLVLRLELAVEEVTQDRLALLARSLSRHKGEVEVALILRQAARWSMEVQLPLPYRVDPSPALLQSLHTIPGVKPLHASQAKDEGKSGRQPRVPTGQARREHERPSRALLPRS